MANNWKTDQVKNITEHPQYGWTTSASKSKAGLKLLRTTDISQRTVNWNTVPVCEKVPDDIEKYLLKKDDILISRAGSVGLSYIAENPPKAVFASYLIRFQAKESVIRSKLLYYFFNSPRYWLSISAGQLGIAVPNVNATKLGEIEVSYPEDIEVQDKLIDELDNLLPAVNKVQSKIQQAKLLIQKFRQAVLSAAVTGKLTEDWRGNNKYKTVTLGRLSTEIPENWELLPFGEKIEVLTDYHANGSYKTLKEHVELMDTEDYAVMIRTTNFEKNDFERNLKYISKHAYEFLKKSKVVPEDILMNKIANPGTSYFMPKIDKPVSLAMNLFLIRTTPDVQQEYAYYFLRAKEGLVKSFARGSTTKTIDKKSVRAIPFIYSPIEEQKEIISQVQSLMKLANQAEQQIVRAEKRVEKLTQSILAKAFRGELL